MGTRRGVRVPVAERFRGGEKGELALMPAQMITNLPTHLRAAGIDHKRYTMHSFRVARAASQDGHARSLWNTCDGFPQLSHADTRRGNSVRGSDGGVKRSRETTFIKADTLCRCPNS